MSTHEIVACIAVTEERTSTSARRISKTPLLRKRKQVNSSFLAPSNPYTLTNTYSRRIANSSKFPQKLDAVTQRVLSGKDHKIKDLESEIGILKSKLCELVNENRLLSSLNRRNDAALSRFQDVEAELPSLLTYHNTEVKALKERYQKLSQEHRDQSRELRSKDLTLQSLRNEISNLNKLIEDKGLKEKQILTNKIEDAKETILELEQQQKHLSRQLNLDKKIFKQHLNKEHKKYKDLKNELDISNNKILELEIKLKSKDKFINDHLTRKEFHQAGRINKRINTSTAVSQQARYTARSQIEDDEEDIDSELSFSQTAAPSIDSIMNHLKYSSSDSEGEEEISQIYNKGRPTSVPQLSLRTTVSTPWAVDSRTFSIRQSAVSVTRQVTPTLQGKTLFENSSTNMKLEGNSNPETSRDVVVTNSKISENSDSNLIDTSIDVKNSKIITEHSEINHSKTPENFEIVSTDIKNSEHTNNTQINNNCKVTNKSELTNSNPEFTKTPEISRNNSEITPEISNNYSKEALLAALKAIDSQPISPPSSKQNQKDTVKKTADTKADLMQELFGVDFNNKTIANS